MYNVRQQHIICSKRPEVQRLIAVKSSQTDSTKPIVTTRDAETGAGVDTRDAQTEPGVTKLSRNTQTNQKRIEQTRQSSGTFKPVEVCPMDVNDKRDEYVEALEEKINILEQQAKDKQDNAANMIVHRLGAHPKVQIADDLATAQHKLMDTDKTIKPEKK